jgi:hypothetical protein
LAKLKVAKHMAKHTLAEIYTYKGNKKTINKW